MTTATAVAPTASVPISFDSHHEDIIHDAQFDFYGKRLATASSDRTVRIFQVEPNQQSEKFLCALTGHEGPVWQVAWAHPKFGGLLASCSYDGSVIIWKESTSSAAAAPAPHYPHYQQQPMQQAQTSQWIKVKEHKVHQASVNSISWAPHEFGLVLACASGDGQVSVLTYSVDSGSWESKVFTAHQIGCNAVSWCPSPSSDYLAALVAGTSHSGPVAKRFVTGGCDNLAKVWRLDEATREWTLEATLEGHSDWVRDVAWSPSCNPTTQQHTIVTCSQDKTVLVWKQSPNSNSWTKSPLASPQDPSASHFSDTVWRLSWSVGGNLLAVSCGDGTISLWRESPQGWELVSKSEQSSFAASN